MPNEPMNSKKPVGTRDWYDFVGQLSSILPGMHMGGQEATDKLLAMCGLQETSHVLDVGCGAGNTACLIAERYGSQVKGIDISEVMIEKAAQRAQRKALTHLAEFRVGDVLELPFDNGTFDVVLVESVLTPLPGDKSEAMAEMVRVLRPGGRLAANEGTLDPSAPPEFLALLEEHPAFYSSFTPDSLRDLFEQAGLSVVQMVQSEYGEPPKALEGMGCGSLLSFMVRDYAKMLVRLLRDDRLRKASRTDDQLKKLSSKYTGYALIVGKKPG